MLVEKLATPDVISCERFELRPVRVSDQGLIGHYAADLRLAKMTPNIPNPVPPGWAEAFVARTLKDDEDIDRWVLDGTCSGRPEVMGVISLQKMDRAQSEISYWVAPAFWNTGIASAAVRGVIDANPQGVQTMFASVFQDNPASARVLTNAGFEYIGDAEAFCVARNSKVSTWTYLKKL